ncbi:MAG: hypothetical protein AAF206_21975 [Bacteroidota bacterium]
MRSILLTLTFGLLALSHCRAQLYAEVNSGADLGWWVYAKGIQPDGSNGGYDRTHLALSIPAEAALMYQFGKWNLGIGYSQRWLDDNLLIGAEDRRGDRTRYFITQNFESILTRHLHLVGRYHWLNTKNYQMYARLQVGSFRSNVDIRDAAEFRRHSWYEISLDQQFQLFGPLQLSLRPRFTRMHISTSESGQSHQLLTIGVAAGLVVRLTKP